MKLETLETDDRADEIVNCNLHNPILCLFEFSPSVFSIEISIYTSDLKNSVGYIWFLKFYYAYKREYTGCEGEAGEAAGQWPGRRSRRRQPSAGPLPLQNY